MMDELNKALHDMVDEMEKKALALDDEGHAALVKDIGDLLVDVQGGNFHDFHPAGHPMPKVALISRLQTLIDATKNGVYDN